CQAWSETETTAAPPQPPATLQQQKLTGGAAQQSIHRAEASLKRYRDILEALECEQALHANGLSDCSDLAKLLCSSPSELLDRLVSAGESRGCQSGGRDFGRADLSAVVAKRVQDWLGIKPAGSGGDGLACDSQQSQSMLDLSADALLSVNVCDMMSQMQQQQRDELDQLLDDEQRLADTADLIVRLVQRAATIELVLPVWPPSGTLGTRRIGGLAACSSPAPGCCTAWRQTQTGRRLAYEDLRTA
uniref:HRDC domain-containing protein n=1 Tax=Macrostomum lignano TaxID=282301 RepID=A0A1I8F815_9PLAT